MTVLVERDSTGVYTMTLNRPEAANAVNRQMTQELAAALDQVAQDPDATALILTGAGQRFFCAGGDIKEYAALSTREEVESQFRAMQAVCDQLSSLPVPTIAAIGGLAVGGGVELALACDFRVATEGATLQLPQVRLGLVTGWGGHWRLVRAVGEARALDLLLTGRPVAAAEALAFGLVHRVGPCAMAEAQALAQAIAQGGRQAVRAMKAVVRHAAGLLGREATEFANRYFFDLWFSPAHREAERAFAERRRQ